MKEDKKKLPAIPLALRAEMALKRAAANAIADHRRTGDPIVIWRDGRIVHIPPAETVVHETGAEDSVSEERGE